MDFDPRLDEMRAHRTFRDLQFQLPKRHAVVVADLTLLLHAQDLVDLDARDRGEGRARLSRRHGEALIVGGQIDFADEGVGRLDRRDPGKPELLHQPVLQGLEGALRTPARLWRIGPDMLDPELLERPADLRQMTAVDLAAGLGRQEVMRAAVGVEAHRQPRRAEHLFQRPEGRSRAFLLDQKRRIDRPRRVVQRHNQIERRLAVEPDVAGAVLMQHHPRHRPTRPLAPMRAEPLRLLQKTLRMKERLRPGVAPGEVVPRHQMLVKMLGGEAQVTLAIQSLDLIRAIDRNPLARRFAEPTIQKPGLAVVLKPLTPTSKRPLVDTKQLRCLHLVELRRLIAAQNVQKPHHTHTLKGFRPAHQIPRKGADATGQIVCYLRRTYHVHSDTQARMTDNWKLAMTSRASRAEKVDAGALARTPSARTIARLLTVGRDQLSKAETVTVAAIETGAPMLVEARDVIANFQTMIRTRLLGDLDPWLERACSSLVASFANGVAKDIHAIRAAISLPWSNGETEGQITKLKLVKRQMYGRGKLDLLEARVVGCP